MEGITLVLPISPYHKTFDWQIVEDMQILGIQPRASSLNARGAKDERRTAMGIARRSAFLHIPRYLISCSPTSWTRWLYSFLPCANRSAVSLAFADRSLYLDNHYEYVVGISVCHCARLRTRQCRRQLRKSFHFPHCTWAK